MRADKTGNVRRLFGLDAGVGPEPARNAGSTAQKSASDGRQLASGRPGAASAKQQAAITRLPQQPEVTPRAIRRLEQRLSVIPNRLPNLDPARDAPIFADLPTASVRKFDYRGLISFAICVLVPMLVATVYYCLIASNRYVAEFRFTVKEASSSASTAVPSGLQSLLGAMGGNNTFDNYLVTDFLSSRQAVEELQRRIKVVDRYSRPNVDWLSRYDASRPIEDFVRYWQSMIAAQYDQVTGIATAKVSAFSPQNALLIAQTLVALSEELVNNMARRSQIDAVRFAQKEVAAAEDRLKAARAKMADYRSRFGIIDPANSVVASNSTLIQTLRANLAQMETQLATLQRQRLQPNAPAVVTLKNQIQSTQAQLQSVEATVGKGEKGTALSRVVGEYEQLELERQFAQNMVTSTMQALEQARANAAAQHLYITPYVRPSLPQSAAYPRPFFGTLKVGALAFVIWLIGLLVVRSIRERFA